jgi:hypothetical protein
MIKYIVLLRLLLPCPSFAVSQCEAIASIALTYPDFRPFYQGTADQLFKRSLVFNSKLANIFESKDLYFIWKGEIDSPFCFNRAISLAKEFPHSLELSKLDLLNEHFWPFSDHALAIPFVYWKYTGADGVTHSGEVNAATAKFLSNPEAGDQRFREEGSPLLRR